MPDTLILFLSIVIISSSISVATVILYDQLRSRQRYSERMLHQERQRHERLGDSSLTRPRWDRYSDGSDRRAA